MPRLSIHPKFDFTEVEGQPGKLKTPDGRIINGTRVPGTNEIEIDAATFDQLFPNSKVAEINDIISRGIVPKAIPFDPAKMMVDPDGKVYTRDENFNRKELPGVLSFDPRTGNMIIDTKTEGDFNTQISKGVANPASYVGPKDAQEALSAKSATETFDEWAGRMEKFGSYALKLGIVIVGVTTIASFVNWLREEAANVNNETFKITEIKREGKISYTSQYKICSGDNIYNFRGFENVNRPSMNNHPEYVTTGGVGTLSDSSQTFEAIEAGVSVKPPEGKELTFRVRTDEMRRLACTLAQVAETAAAAAANIGKSATKGFFEGLGIDPVWLIVGIVVLIIGAIVASIVFKK